MPLEAGAGKGLRSSRSEIDREGRSYVSCGSGFARAHSFGAAATGTNGLEA